MAQVIGSDQMTITDVTDAYSVILSNESHTFVGSTSSALAGTATTNVYAFRGSEAVSLTVGTITGATGITASISNNGSTSPLVTFTVTTALTSGGTIDIPVTIAGTDVTITKKFTYGIAFKGSTGATGATGKGVSKIENYFLASDKSSDITNATSGFTTAIQSTDTTKKYLWSYQLITYTDSSTAKTTATIIGTHGATGATGATGNGISKVTNYYLTTSASSGVTTSTTGWSTTPTATDTTKKYIWCYQLITYTSGSTATTTPAIIGTHGATGATGAAGMDAITISITTDNGNIFKNSEGTTTLTAHVYQGGEELTESEISALGTLKWYKDGSTTASDTGPTISVAASSIENKAVYTVQLEG